MKKLFKKNLLMIVSALILAAASQIIGYIIRRSGGFYICNEGVGFGIRIPEGLIWIFYAVFWLGLAYLVLSGKYRYNIISLSLVLGGVISNIIDRLAYGCVVDYIDIKVWPVFNLADVSICVGALLLIIDLLDKKNRI